MSTPRADLPQALLPVQGTSNVTFTLPAPPKLSTVSLWTVEVRDGCGEVCITYKVTSWVGCDLTARLDDQLCELCPGVYDLVLVDPWCRECGRVRYDNTKAVALHASASNVAPPLSYPAPPVSKVGRVFEPWLTYCTTTTTPLSMGATVITVSSPPPVGVLPVPIELQVWDGTTDATVSVVEVRDNTLILGSPMQHTTVIPQGATVQYAWTMANVASAVAGT